MAQPLSRAIELNRDRDPVCHARNHAKKPTQAKPIADSEHNRVRHRPSKQSQGTVLSAQQIVGKVQTPDYIQASPGDADRGQGVMVHGKILRATQTPEHFDSGTDRRSRLFNLTLKSLCIPPWPQ